MSVKIIKEGCLPENIIKTTECHNCNSTFSFQDTDIKKIRKYIVVTYEYIECPFCKEKINPDDYFYY